MLPALTKILSENLFIGLTILGKKTCVYHESFGVYQNQQKFCLPCDWVAFGAYKNTIHYIFWRGREGWFVLVMLFLVYDVYNTWIPSQTYISYVEITFIIIFPQKKNCVPKKLLQQWKKLWFLSVLKYSATVKI